MNVSSPLSLDTNVVVLREPVAITLSGVELQEGEECPITATSDPPAQIEVEAVFDEVANDRAEGNPTQEDMGESPDLRGHNFLVTLLPTEAVEYTLEVKYRGKHVPGSPYSVVAQDTTSTAAENQLKEGKKDQGIIAGQPVTFVLPGSPRAQSPVVTVRGPQGMCEAFSSSDSSSVSFSPNQPGVYVVCLRSQEGGSKEEEEEEREEEEKYYIVAINNEMGAKKCYVLEPDKGLFQSPIRFSEGAKVSFRVCTKEALGMNLLRVIARGPSQANVTISETTLGEEDVVFEPASPGRYSLDVLWSGHHIRGSPFTLHFRQPKSQVSSNGLNLSEEAFVIDTPLRFKLCCEGDDQEGDIRVWCEPPSAACISVIPIGSPSTYLCEIIPRECGTHNVSVQLQGIHAPGSPFAVLFRPKGDALKCQLEDTLQRVQSSPSLKFYVNTEGAGEGRLTAVAREEVTGDRMVATVSRLDKCRYMVEFTPGRGMECKLGVQYDGQHIPGSPFNLLFPGAASFTVEGSGLVRATVGEWSLFTVHSINTGPGVFSVSIEGPESTNVAPTITSKGNSMFDVRYLPLETGQYVVSVRWGQHHIPGSPFTVQCISNDTLSHFAIWRPSSRVPLGNSVEFTVEDGRTDREKEGDSEEVLCVQVKAQHTSEVLAASTSKDSDGNIFCQFQPPAPGSYSIAVTWKGADLPGSPFRLTVPSPPRAERVRVWGDGLQDHQLSPHGSQFTVDTSDAGSGILGIKVSKLY